MYSWKTLAMVIAVVVIGGSGYLTVGTAADTKNIEQMIAEAETSEDHTAIAKFYAKQGQEAKKSVAQHERMKASYQMSYPIRRALMIQHCDKLLAQYSALETSYAELAVLHAGMAQAVE